MGERFGCAKAALTEEEMLVHLSCVIKMRLTKAPGGLWHKSHREELRLLELSSWSRSFSAEAPSLSISVSWDCLTFRTVLAFLAPRMSQLGAV